MRQRLGLGVAILASPDLLLLDEPTAGLDQQGLEVLWAVVRQWRESGRMVLVSTHDLALVERHVDEIQILRAGRVLAVGSSDELRRTAALPHRVWLDLDVERDHEARVVALCDALARLAPRGIERLGHRVRADVAADAVVEIVEILSRFPGVVVGIRVEEPTLDLVYGSLLGAG